MGRPTWGLQPLSNDVIDVSESAVVEQLENSPYPSLVEKVELFLEKPLAGENQYLVKGRYEAPGAAVLYCFDEIRAQAKDNLAEPGFRPGEIPPWIKADGRVLADLGHGGRPQVRRRM